MDIDTFDAPRAGRLFRYTLRGSSKFMRSKAYINGQLVHSGDCPDPPCHEEFMVPESAGGGTLRVLGENAAGQTISRDFIILGRAGSTSSGFSAAG